MNGTARIQRTCTSQGHRKQFWSGTANFAQKVVATSFKSHEICRISTFFCLTSYCLHIVIVNTLYLV